MSRKTFLDLMRAAGAASAKVKRDHFPEASQKVEIALAPERLAALDAWIARQADPKPDRKEAVLHLLDKALSKP